MRQLTIDGRDEPIRPHTGRAAPLSPAQTEILRWVAKQGEVTCQQAGRIVHAHSGQGERMRAFRDAHYASSDGWDALKRLVARGLLVNKNGRYRSVPR